MKSEDLEKRKQKLIEAQKVVNDLLGKAKDLRRRFGKGIIKIERHWDNPTGCWEQFFDEIDALSMEYDPDVLESLGPDDFSPKQWWKAWDSNMPLDATQTTENSSTDATLSSDYEEEDEITQKSVEEEPRGEQTKFRASCDTDGEIEAILGDLESADYTVPSVGLKKQEGVWKILIENKKKEVEKLERQLEKQREEKEFYKKIAENPDADFQLARNPEAGKRIEKLREMRDILNEIARIHSLTNPLSLYYKVGTVGAETPEPEFSPWKRCSIDPRHRSGRKGFL